MQGQTGGQPIIILRQGTEETRGDEAKRSNIMAARAVAEAVRTTLGPKGLDKMITDPAGLVIITNDGATILDEMKIKHPAAKLVAEVAKTQDDEVGDGTTTAAVLTGEFLKGAQELMEIGVHPTTIIHGYNLASHKSKEILSDIAVHSTDEHLRKIAETALTGKGVEFSREKLANLVVTAVKSIVKKENGKKTVNIKDISIERRGEGSVEDSELVEGIILDKTKTHQSMPSKIENAKIAILATPIEVRKTETKSEISIESIGQTRMFLEQEENLVRAAADKVIKSGANVVFCQKGVDDMARYFLAKAGIFVSHRIKKNDLIKLSRATGGKIITSLDEIKPDTLGEAGLVEEKMVGNGEMIFITGCKNPDTNSILLRGGSEHVVTSLARAMHDALRVVGVAIEDEKILAGGGSPEIELALRLREYASTLEGREQLAVSKFALALEIIPKTLAENAGLDAIDMLVELRSSHEHGNKTVGLDVFEGKPVDMLTIGVIEPLRVKTQAISSATEAASMILRIDDVIASAKDANPKKKPDMSGLD
ncbi:MAG: Hsp60 [Candidatus Methanoperedens nitroreducens]|uniref:Hsp60 n=1 Tax=Candidatus Methanoperedens nitratireducens TaxID=1392998 RepID=A0A0P7ZFM4_9EURY|nr:thermosome subunit alpha [Candidatus Methanoperedens sp. BLZ2]KAB2947500.1 MAG: thermosome subunit [Candidatus Methanoperedens sp.]KPQ42374.1 MAG: Hsp60 [Candidatus Methanoperedens sp. BLZ1]MBZ0175121.1 TCP-1/cpn60 chaperonin family protein [Candidatus Methanoperedens nitroreducens]MCX9078686.1 thermosome subunit alpha [Candidatus Methanoperedens sp.]